MGGGSGRRAGRLDVQDALSFGRRAAVQSIPIHHRWFSCTVNLKERDEAGGTPGGMDALVVAVAVIFAMGSLLESSTGSGDPVITCQARRAAYVTHPLLSRTFRIVTAQEALHVITRDPKIPKITLGERVKTIIT